MGFASETTHRTRKQRRCDSCLQMIEIGEPYVRWVGVTDGDFGTAPFHPDCREAEIKVNRELLAFDDEWASLHEYVSEEGMHVLDGVPESVRQRFIRLVAEAS